MSKWRGVAAVGLLLALSACGDEGTPATTEQQQRAQAAGLDASLMYATKVEGYELVAGGSGVYGDAGFQAIYFSPQGADLRLTVERASIDASTCPKLPIPAAEAVTAEVACTEDEEGWVRSSGDRHEYAVVRGDLLVRASGTTAEVAREAALDAHPASKDEMEAVLPPTAEGQPEMGPSETAKRGDIHGDNAPDNGVGAGG